MASVKLTINGKEVTAQAGQTILEAANASGIEIPTLCHHKALKPIGACRVCLVEVSGQRTLQPACTFPVTNGLKVETESDKANEARRFVLELIFSERNHFCMYCELSGDCELQKLAYRFGLDHMTYPAYTHAFPVDATPTYHLLDHNRCVLCRRCVRACAELAGNHTLDLRQRGASTMIHADMNLKIGESSCVSCGTCIDVCPTGALIDKRSAFMGRKELTESVKTICSRCSMGCGMEVTTRGGNVLRVNGDWDAPVNRGLLCQKGRFEVLYENRPRLLKPLISKDGKQREVSWEAAVKEVAARLTASAGKLGVLSSSWATNEALGLVGNLFGKRLRATVGALTGAAPRLGNGRNGSLADLANADCILVAGVDPAKDQPVASFLVKRALDRGARLILLEGGQTVLAALADQVFGAREAQKAVEPLLAAAHGVVLYGPGVSKEATKALAQLEGKVAFVALQPGVNTARAVQVGLNGGGDAKGLEALYVLVGEEPWDGKGLIKKLGKGAFLVVQASYESPLTRRADVVLPAAIWSETSGSLTNTEGIVQRLSKVTAPQGQAKADWEILELLASKIGK